jgi:hypothetical protein
MKSKSILTSILIIAALLFIAAPVQAGHAPFYFEKVCDGSVALDICTIQNAAPPFGFLNGGTIQYIDHAYFENPAGVVIESATVLVIAGDGSQTYGHVRWIKDRGYYTLLPGSGSFANMHMIGDVAVLSWETWTFSVSGSYFVTP